MSKRPLVAEEAKTKTTKRARVIEPSMKQKILSSQYSNDIWDLIQDDLSSALSQIIPLLSPSDKDDIRNSIDQVKNNQIFVDFIHPSSIEKMFWAVEDKYEIEPFYFERFYDEFVDAANRLLVDLFDKQSQSENEEDDAVSSEEDEDQVVGGSRILTRSALGVLAKKNFKDKDEDYSNGDYDDTDWDPEDEVEDDEEELLSLLDEDEAQRRANEPLLNAAVLDRIFQQSPSQKSEDEQESVHSSDNYSDDEENASVLSKEF